MKEIVKKIVLDLGADVCGIANIKRFTDVPKEFSPIAVYPACKSVIVFGVALPKGLMKVEPSLIYGHFNSNSCLQVDKIAFQAAKEIEKKYGGFAVPLPCDSPYEYWDSENQEGRGLISMKNAAVLAGIGTLGKSTLLLNQKYGNLLTIGAILTELDIESDQFAESICIEGCRLCINNCPVHALDGESASQFKCRPNTYGTNKRGFGTVNCNKCREICPMKYGKVDLEVLRDERVSS